MTDATKAESAEPTGFGRITPIEALIAVIMLVAITTTIQGLLKLTGVYLYAVPFGFVAQSIMLIVSLNLGRDLARLASGRATTTKTSIFSRALRMTFLVAIYLLFFGICWFLAFSTYYNIFLQRGDDVQTTVSQAEQLRDMVLDELRLDTAESVRKSSAALRDAGPVHDFVIQAREFQRAVGNPEIADTIATAVSQAKQTAFTERQKQREQWRNDRDNLARLQTDNQRDATSPTNDISDAKAKLGQLSSQMTDLRRAIQLETTGLLPIPEGAPPPAAATPPAAVARAKGASKPPAFPTPPTGASPPRLKADGPAAQLLPKVAACMTERSSGPGDCSKALEAALVAAENRFKELTGIIQGQERTSTTRREAAEVRSRQIAALNELIEKNPPLDAPVGGYVTGGRPLGADLAPLIDTLERETSESALNAIEIACKPIASTLTGLKSVLRQKSNSDIIEKLLAFDCRPANVLSAIRRHGDSVKAHGAFLARCDGSAVTSPTGAIVAKLQADFAIDGNPYRKDAKAGRIRLKEALDAVQQDIVAPCYPLAEAVGVLTSAVKEKARAFAEQINPDQSDFSLAFQAASLVWQRQGTPPAYLGALFAAAQELTILLLSILRDINRASRATEPATPVHPVASPMTWGFDPRDTPTVAAAKAILRAQRSGADDAIRLPLDFGKEEKAEDQANIQQLLRELKRDGTARRTLFGFGSAVRLNFAAIEKLDQLVREGVRPLRPEPQNAGAAAWATAGSSSASTTPRPDEPAPAAETQAAGTESRSSALTDAGPTEQGVSDLEVKKPSRRKFGTRA